MPNSDGAPGFSSVKHFNCENCHEEFNSLRAVHHHKMSCEATHKHRQECKEQRKRVRRSRQGEYGDTSVAGELRPKLRKLNNDDAKQDAEQGCPVNSASSDEVEGVVTTIRSQSSGFELNAPAEPGQLEPETRSASGRASLSEPLDAEQNLMAGSLVTNITNTVSAINQESASPIDVNLSFDNPESNEGVLSPPPTLTAPLLREFAGALEKFVAPVGSQQTQVQGQVQASETGPEDTSVNEIQVLNATTPERGLDYPEAVPAPSYSPDDVLVSHEMLFPGIERPLTSGESTPTLPSYDDSTNDILLADEFDDEALFGSTVINSVSLLSRHLEREMLLGFIDSDGDYLANMVSSDSSLPASEIQENDHGENDFSDSER